MNIWVRIHTIVLLSVFLMGAAVGMCVFTGDSAFFLLATVLIWVLLNLCQTCTNKYTFLPHIWAIIKYRCTYRDTMIHHKTTNLLKIQPTINPSICTSHINLFSFFFTLSNLGRVLCNCIQSHVPVSKKLRLKEGRM